MSLDVTPVIDDVLTIEELERAWHGPRVDGRSAATINNAQLTITRNGAADFQDRQVYLFVDEEPWGKVRYGKAVTREIARPSPRSGRASKESSSS